MIMIRRLWPICAAATIVFVFFFYFNPAHVPRPVAIPLTRPFDDEFTKPKAHPDSHFQWASRHENFPVPSLRPFPTGSPTPIPKIQYEFPPETADEARDRLAKRNGIRKSFARAWEGYKNHAWLKDELLPLSGGSLNRFGGWAATLIDSLDTLWIMDMKTDFAQAVANLGEIDFSKSEDEEVNVFETTIRYLGGLLSAYDLSEKQYPVLLEKAVELGNLLYAAFDTPDRMPITRWKWQRARNGEVQDSGNTPVAETGSLSLEFTRLSQITGDMKFFDAIQRITDRLERAQGLTKLPGMWPIVLDPKEEDFGGDTSFTLGAMADSVYEYLPKEYMLLNGLAQQYKQLYEYSIDTAKEYLFFRPMTQENADILMSGNIHVDPEVPGRLMLDPQGQHLACFAGGMVGLGSRVFNRPDDLPIARKLTEGCIWAYRAMPTGIMPERFYVFPCANATDCFWDAEQANNVPGFPGFTDIPDTRYVLRPEAIESVFILYRITGDPALRASAWAMFEAIEGRTRTQYGSAALDDVTKIPSPKSDSMESFWTAETLKYFYLIFSTPDVISLDDWVLNTEAHPFRRPVQG